MESIAIATIITEMDNSSAEMIMKWTKHHFPIGRLLIFVVSDVGDSLFDTLEEYADVWQVKQTGQTTQNKTITLENLLSIVNGELDREITDENGVFVYVPIDEQLVSGKLQGSAIGAAVLLEILERTSPINIDCVGPRKIAIVNQSASDNQMLQAAIYLQSHFVGLNCGPHNSCPVAKHLSTKQMS